MRSSRGIVYVPARPARSALIVRSEMNIRRSRALVTSAQALVRARQIRRRKLAGGSDSVGKNACAV